MSLCEIITLHPFREMTPAGTYGFSETVGHERRFRNFGGDVYFGTLRLPPSMVEGFLSLFQSEQAWRLHDDLLAARDGITEPCLSGSRPQELDVDV